MYLWKVFGAELAFRDPKIQPARDAGPHEWIVGELTSIFSLLGRTQETMLQE